MATKFEHPSEAVESLVDAVGSALLEPDCIFTYSEVVERLEELINGQDEPILHWRQVLV